MTWQENISAEEARCMEELKNRLKNDLTPALLDDETLFYRFSKARDFVIADAEAMLRKHIFWREQYNVDRILVEHKPSEVIKKYVPFYFVCYDKEGSPVLYIDFGNTDIKGVFNSIKPIEILSHCVFTLEGLTEKCRAQTAKLGRPVTKACFIFNFENLTFANATNKKMLETALFFAKMFQDNYPERIKSIYFINTSLYFTLAFNVIKHVLASVVLSKIRCYSPDDDWRGALLEKIDAELLPAFLGGTRTDPDGNPLCHSIIPPTKKVPETFYLTNSAKKLSRSKDVKKMTVTRLSKETWSYEVTEPGSYLEWEFETKNKDIGFAVLYKPNTDCKSSELLPKTRIDTCYEPEKGFLRCDKPGTYICVFDNSYSWIYSKELYFRIKVKSPQEVDSCT
ncbi:SEC14-like protein 2 like protein [Argiope bruennichi]|uniref:SEC14-like protein 2 like protein n=1 Tax=Argiope bruennichi TaxID=94029 RepID=A0A8T0FPQ0_ARGBR|nr:SEC14-like protein 2 like protein [Argiope bruennichi]